MLNFCTLFNSTYLSRGLAMYNSLEQHSENFHLYILAFDSDCLNTLIQLDLAHATVISLEEFENQHLLAVKAERTVTEYCWTCASSSIKYCMNRYGLDHCTYIDADLLFFANPRVLYDEMGEKSVQITPHRYSSFCDQSATSGIYCVQYMTFKNTTQGMEVLNWWINACLEWCFCRVENGKFGDQKYLDDWLTRFDCVQELQHLGGGVAPWNIQQYQFKKINNKICGIQLADRSEFKLIFYHYHAFKYAWNDSFLLTDQVYPLTKNQIRYIYRPYILALSRAEELIGKVEAPIVPYKRTDEGMWIKRVLGRRVIFFLRGFYKDLYSRRYFKHGIFN